MKMISKTNSTSVNGVMLIRRHHFFFGLVR